MTLRTISGANITGKTVLVRVDFNVPLDGGTIRDDTRIVAALPTIQALLDANNAVILVSHLGRPKGKVDPKYSLKPVAEHLATLVSVPVEFASDVVGPDAQAKASALQARSILLLENVRYEPGEEKNDPELAKSLAGLAEVYVNDAFGAAHRAHASTVGVATYLPSYAGLLMAAEVEALSKLVESPRDGFVAIIGGAKVSDKIGVLENLTPKVETLIIGGGMANTFLLAAGLQLGTSLVEEDAVEQARAIQEAARSAGATVLLPTDVVVAESIDAAKGDVVPVEDVPSDKAIYDIGPSSIDAFSEVIKGAKTIFWNGPMGVFEKEPFAAGTNAVARAVADSGAYSLVGGGDSVAAINAAGLEDKISHISTGGGASLEFVEGRELPGITALMDN